MPQIKRNSCRVCLSDGTKQIFGGHSSPEASLPKGLQYDRLAEKLRFVSMLPVSRGSMRTQARGQWLNADILAGYQLTHSQFV